MAKDRDQTFTEEERPSALDSWGIGSTPMLESEANAISDYVCRTYPQIHAFPLNPRTTMGLFLDRWSVQLLRDALAGMGDEPRVRANMIEHFDEWLAAADPVDE